MIIASKSTEPSLKKPSLDQLLLETDKDMAHVNQLIFSEIESSVPLISQVAGYLITSGGKRLRPLLTLACARLCGYEGVSHHYLATCIEFIHTATLLHDDVVDQSLLRRGLATAHTLWGETASVLVGDFLLSRAFQLMVKVKSLEVMDILSKAAALIAEGEVMQLSFQQKLDLSQEKYMEIITSKTACLFQAACEVGAVLTHRPSHEREALRTFGLYLGVAFQLMDDALDYSAAQEVLGKKVGKDFCEGKVTLPALLAYEKGTENQKAFWKRTFQEFDQKETDLETALRFIKETGSLEDTFSLAKSYVEKGIQALHIFPETPLRSALEEAALFSIERSF